MDHIDTKKKYEAIVAISFGFTVLYLIFMNVYFIYTSVTILGIGLLIPSLANIVAYAWYKIAEVLGAIMSKLILSIVFYLLLFPISLLSRIFKSDSLKLRPNYKTMFIHRDHEYTSEDLKNIW